MEPVEESLQVKTMKLNYHSRTTTNTDDILFNQRDLPFTVNPGDLLEIYHPGSDAPRLLIQVKQLPKEHAVPKDTLSITNVIGKKFELQPSKEIQVCKAKADEVAADLVELLYKDQYFSRSDMWRMRRALIGSCLYHGQSVEFTDMRASVDELWSKGDRIACAAVNNDTRFVYRSSTAQVNIFIQMSREMWEFDRYGDLIWEKTLDGLLVDLFTMWKEKSCNHDVTITLFSRQYYVAQSINDFPPTMQQCVQVDYIGRFYEDFYRVVVQNERYEDWTQSIKILRRLFNEYNDYVLHFHDSDWKKTYVWDYEGGRTPCWNPAAALGKIPNTKTRINNNDDFQSRNFSRHKCDSGTFQRVPQSYNSSSAEGNVLEVFNMALNVFEKYYIDRGFDRTGKLSIVITPGQGIFDVDRELANITKQRTIDCGCSSDLVCMAEKPLHAVPLFKFHNKVRSSSVSPDVGDDYNIPHWINYSFYVSRVQQFVKDKGIFVPDCGLVESINRGRRLDSQSSAQNKQTASGNDGKEENYVVIFKSSAHVSHLPLHNTATEVPYSYYDNYDSKLYKLPSHVDFFDPNDRRRTIDDIGCNSRALREIQPRILDDSEQDVAWNSSSNLQDTELGGVSCRRASQRSGSTPPKFDSQSAPSSDFPLLSGRSPTVGGGNAAYYMESQRQVGSAGSSSGGFWRPGSSGKKLRRRHRALINPFAPSRLYFQATSSRRRWAHTFPVTAQISRGIRKPRRGVLGSSHEHLYATPGNKTVESRRRHVRNASDGSDILSRSIGGSYRSTDGAALMMEHHETRPRTRSVVKSDMSPLSGESVRSRPISLAVSPQTNHDQADILLGMNFSYGRDGGELMRRMEERHRTAPRGAGTRAGRGREDLGYLRDSLEWVYGGGISWFSSCRNEDKYVPQCPTGIDWKSMSVPASLPLTTDYFPDAGGIARDYVLNVDVLIPDDIYLSMVLQEGRRQLSARQVYNAMINQRLAQGFQLVILPPPTSAAGAKPSSSNLLSPSTGGPSPLDQSSSSSSLSYPSDTRSAPLKISGKPGMIELNKALMPKYRGPVLRKPVLSKGLPVKTPSLISAHSQNSMNENASTTEEVILSVGRIFQKIELNEGKITVTRYTPRHPYPQQTVPYKYRFQVPDSLTYNMSWTDFTYEKLEDYKWNYVDQYLTTRGEGDFHLMESLKYWRARFFLLPSLNPATKQIIEDKSKFCDIYEELNTPDRFKLIDGCLKFLESANKLIKVKRTVASATPAISSAALAKSLLIKKEGGDLIGRRYSHSSISHSVITTDSSSSVSAGVGLLGSELKKSVLLSSADVPVSQHLLPPTMIRVGTPPVGKTESNRKSIIVSNVGGSQSIVPPSALLSITSPGRDLVEAVLDASDGVTFFKHSPGLPPLFAPSFLSAEAVHWAVKNVSGCDTAPDGIRLFSRLLEEGFINHASGDSRVGFVYGFYLYCVCMELDENLKPTDANNLIRIPYNPAFEREWCEVAFVADYAESLCLPLCSDISRSESFDVESCDDSLDHLDVRAQREDFRQKLKIPGYKHVHVESDPQRKSDCEEWGTGKYHKRYSPTAAFELMVEWLVATGMILGELVYNWARRATTFGFHFLPVPCDPFALPFTRNSDPLRGPIFVPLNMSCLVEGDGDPFNEFSAETRGERLAMFQELVLKRFGFMRDACPSRRSLCVAGQNESPPQYVHITGTIFSMLLTASQSEGRSTGRVRTESFTGRVRTESFSVHHHSTITAATLQQQHREYVAYQCHQQTNCGGEVGGDCKHVGYLWVWNFMMTKRWRSTNTGSEVFQDKMLSDFKEFCSNTGDRLRTFWNSLRQETLDKNAQLALFTSEEVDECEGNKTSEEPAGQNESVNKTEANESAMFDSSNLRITITEA